MSFIGVSRHKNKIVYFFRKEVGGYQSWMSDVSRRGNNSRFFGQLNSLSLSSQKTEQFCVFCDMEETNQRQVKTFQNTMRKIEPQSLRIIVVSQL
jgi:hypothetical protein